MKRILLVFSVLFALAAAARAGELREEVRWDYLEHASPTTRDLREITIIDRTPLFANAPFLRLRPGDKLIRAVSGPEGKDVMSGTTRVGYYLQTAGARYSIDVQEKDGQLQLDSGSLNPVFFFEWDVTAVNAASLYTLLYRRHLPLLRFEHWEAIVEAVRKEFPTIEIASWPGPYDRIESHPPPALATVPGQSYAVFAGVTVDDYTNEIYQFSVCIGPHVARITGRTLLQGPRHVDRDEFEGVHYAASSIAIGNARGPYDVDPATAKIKKAEYDRMLAFQTLVKEAMKPRPAP